MFSTFENDNQQNKTTFIIAMNLLHRNIAIYIFKAMGLTKTDAFTKRQNIVAAICKALGHPARIAILEHLIQTNTCITGDLVEVLPLSQATVSQHLKELKNMGVIQGTIEGTSVCYCINESKWNEIAQTLNLMLKSYNPSCC